MRLLFLVPLLAIACGGKDDGDTGADAAVDADRDGFGADVDCDDANPRIHPEAPEVCGGVDDDCDGLIDAEDDSLDPSLLRSAYTDGDGDGAGDPASEVLVCDLGAGQVASGNDCNDGDPAIGPNALEVCNGRDDNCNELVDGDDPVLDLLSRTTWFEDADGDGFGSPTRSLASCDMPAGYVLDNSDCNDAIAEAFPGAPERCNDGIDDDCDGFADDQDPEGAEIGTSTFYPDEDRDDWGAEDGAVQACEEPSGFVAQAGDCDDERGDRSPGEVERCNGRDDDCDELIDDADPDVQADVLFYRDADGDSYGAEGGATVLACVAPVGFAASAGDCDDGEEEVFPGALETCNDRDDDCDTLVDDADPTVDPSSVRPYFADADGDGYGVEPSLGDFCGGAPGRAERAGDCNDLDFAVNPAAAEVCNLRDDDCDALLDEDDPSVDLSTGVVIFPDGDGDGYGEDSGAERVCTPRVGWVEVGGDCAPDDLAVHPGAEERCNDGLDDDCDGLADEADDSLDPASLGTFYEDRDGDGHHGFASVVLACTLPPDASPFSTDCDDGNPSISPDGSEVCGGADEDCDGLRDDADDSVDPDGFTDFYLDFDLDGFGDPLSVVAACAAPAGYVANALDCLDQFTEFNPLAAESCLPYDEDCDGLLDQEDPDLRPEDLLVVYPDADGDGWGDALDPQRACRAEVGFADRFGDCDDGDSRQNPEAPEVCNGEDDDCDGLVDDDDTLSPDGLLSFFLDSDGDGFGDPSVELRACRPDPGFLAEGGDCDDLDDAVFPGAPERCNGGRDDDCDWAADDADPDIGEEDFVLWFADEDGDGFGLPDDVIAACDGGPGRSLRDGDCDDADPYTYPGASELCDGRVNRCGDPAWAGDRGLVTWFAEGSAPSDLTAAFSNPGGRTRLPVAGTLALCTGVFDERVSVDAAGVVVRGYGADPSQVLLFGDAGGSVVDQTVSGALQLEGLTLLGGCAAEGPSLHLAADSEVSLVEVDLVAGDCADRGGVIFASGVALTLDGVVADGGRAAEAGGFLYQAGGSLTALNLELQGFDAPEGGQFWLDGLAEARFEGGRLSGSTADRGGAVFSRDTDLALFAVVVEEFSAGEGASFHVQGGRLDLEGALIRDNTTSGEGVVRAIDLSGGRCDRSAVVANRAGPEGAALALHFAEGATFELVSCDLGLGLDANLPADLLLSGLPAIDAEGVVDQVCDATGCR